MGEKATMIDVRMKALEASVAVTEMRGYEKPEFIIERAKLFEDYIRGKQRYA